MGDGAGQEILVGADAGREGVGRFEREDGVAGERYEREAHLPVPDRTGDPVGGGRRRLVGRCHVGGLEVEDGVLGEGGPAGASGRYGGAVGHVTAAALGLGDRTGEAAAGVGDGAREQRLG